MQPGPTQSTVSLLTMLTRGCQGACMKPLWACRVTVGLVGCSLAPRNASVCNLNGRLVAGAQTADDCLFEDCALTCIPSLLPILHEQCSGSAALRRSASQSQVFEAPTGRAVDRCRKHAFGLQPSLGLALRLPVSCAPLALPMQYIFGKAASAQA